MDQAQLASGSHIISAWWNEMEVGNKKEIRKGN